MCSPGSGPEILVDATPFGPSSRSRNGYWLDKLGRQGAHKTRRLAKLGAAAISDASTAPCEIDLHLRARKRDIGEASLLVAIAVAAILRSRAPERQQALFIPTDEDDRPLATLRSMDGE